jgi:hypothetical protein
MLYFEWLHRKKKVPEFPVPSRDVTTKLSLGGNNDVITELFLPRGSLVGDIPAGVGKLVNLFLRCTEPALYMSHQAALPTLYRSIIFTHLEENSRMLNYHTLSVLKSQGETHMVQESSHVKYLSLNHVSNIGLKSLPFELKIGE